MNPKNLSRNERVDIVDVVNSHNTSFENVHLNFIPRNDECRFESRKHITFIFIQVNEFLVSYFSLLRFLFFHSKNYYIRQISWPNKAIIIIYRQKFIEFLGNIRKLNLLLSCLCACVRTFRLHVCGIRKTLHCSLFGTEN